MHLPEDELREWLATRNRCPFASLGDVPHNVFTPWSTARRASPIVAQIRAESSSARSHLRLHETRPPPPPPVPRPHPGRRPPTRRATRYFPFCLFAPPA